MSARSQRILFAILIVSSLLLAIAILADPVPHLRGPAPGTSEWYWPYLLRPINRWWPAVVAALFISAVAAWWIRQDEQSRVQTAIFLIAIFAGSLLLQLTMIYADRSDVAAELIDRTLSNQASGFFEAAADIHDINQLLADYPQAMPAFVSEHARTHPPGMVLANWLAITLFAEAGSLAEPVAALVQPLRCTDLWLYGRPDAVSAALGAWALIPLLFAAATVFPAYGVAQQLLSDQASKLATILIATIPALILFAPKSVQLYAPLTLIMFWAFHTGLAKQSIIRVLLAGAVGSLMTFLSLGNITMFLIIGLYALFSVLFIARDRKAFAPWPQSVTQIAGQIVVFSVGVVSIWLLYWLIWDVTPSEIARAGLDQHYELVTNLRSYEWWVGWNLVDLFLFSGWPLALGFSGSLILAFRLWRRKRLEAVDILAVVLGLVILVLNFSGSARGEVGRLWLFLMPLLAYPGARFWASTLPSKRYTLSIVVMQLLLLLCLGWAWRPVRAVIVVAEAPVVVNELPHTTINAVFVDEPIILTGYTLSDTTVEPGDTLALTLFWKAEGAASRPYTVFNHLINENGDLTAQQDNWSVAGSWPPSCWHNEEIVVDEYELTIPDDTAAGKYRLMSGLYDAQSGERLFLTDEQDVVVLAEIEVLPR